VIGAAEAVAFERCIIDGGIAVFPTDTLYGLGCSADDDAARERLYELKGRPRDKPSAVMFFSMEAAEPVLAELGPRTRDALEAILPGPVLAVLPGSKGIRIPRVEGPLRSVHAPVLQTSANLTGGPDPRRLADVPDALRSGADLVLDGGELPGVASTVVDFTGDEPKVLRAGAGPFEPGSILRRNPGEELAPWQ
jgi:L-threonylcarbamoyladenylate synthase